MTEHRYGWKLDSLNRAPSFPSGFGGNPDADRVLHKFPSPQARWESIYDTLPSDPVVLLEMHLDAIAALNGFTGLSTPEHGRVRVVVQGAAQGSSYAFKEHRKWVDGAWDVHHVYAVEDRMALIVVQDPRLFVEEFKEYSDATQFIYYQQRGSWAGDKIPVSIARPKLQCLTLLEVAELDRAYSSVNAPRPKGLAAAEAHWESRRKKNGFLDHKSLREMVESLKALQ